MSVRCRCAGLYRKDVTHWSAHSTTTQCVYPTIFVCMNGIATHSTPSIGCHPCGASQMQTTACHLYTAALDGSHVKIVPPAEFERAYVNRHGYHSLNLLVLAGIDYRFYYAVVRWPGSVGDARVLINSEFYQRCQSAIMPFRPFPGN
jgi:hypothetical protein